MIRLATLAICALAISACSSRSERFGPAPVGPFGAPADAGTQQRSMANPTRRDERIAPEPRVPCQSDWCRTNCTKTNPSLPLQCKGYQLVDVQGNAPPATVSSAGAICRSAGKC